MIDKFESRKIMTLKCFVSCVFATLFTLQGNKRKEIQSARNCEKVREIYVMCHLARALLGSSFLCLVFLAGHNSYKKHFLVAISFNLEVVTCSRSTTYITYIYYAGHPPVTNRYQCGMYIDLHCS